MDLDQQVKEIMEVGNSEKIDRLIHQYTPFIVSTVSNRIGRYLSIENDEEFSVGLAAFHEAMERYQIEKGHFLPFAKLVIQSRLISRNKRSTNDEQIIEWDEQIHSRTNPVDSELKAEIEEFEIVLNRFGLNFESLVEQAPKHKDTRERANGIAFQTSRVSEFVKHIYEKRRLPIVRMAERLFVSIKVIKRSKAYILAAVVIWTEKFSLLQQWLKPKESSNFQKDM